MSIVSRLDLLVCKCSLSVAPSTGLQRSVITSDGESFSVCVRFSFDCRQCRVGFLPEKVTCGRFMCHSNVTIVGDAFVEMTVGGCFVRHYG